MNKDLSVSNESKQDLMNNTRKVSDGKWKDGLNEQEVDLIENIKNKQVKNTIKNRIDLENKTKK